MSAKKRGPLLIISTYGLRKGVGTRITYVFRYLTRRNTQRIIKTYKRNMINCFLHHFPHSAVFCILLSCQEYYSEYLLSKVQYLLVFQSTRIQIRKRHRLLWLCSLFLCLEDKIFFVHLASHNLFDFQYAKTFRIVRNKTIGQHG